MNFDIIIVGSGPGGIHAAQEALLCGARVGLIDVGHRDDTFDKITPAQAWSEIRRTCADQGRFFLGESMKHNQADSRSAAQHLAPARQYVLKDAEQLLPVRSDSFEAVQSLAVGGLGAGWGAGCARLTHEELERIGLPVGEMSHWYESVAREIGISGPADDDVSGLIGQFCTKQPALPLDSNSEAILRTYHRNRARLVSTGFRLGQPPLAVLTESHEGRSANPLHDMDYWSDAGESVWRPRFTLRTLQHEPNFSYVSARLVEGFKEDARGGVQVHARNLESGNGETFTCRRLLLAAGAINSARLVLHSNGYYDVRTPLLCNPYTYVPAINLPMLGRTTRDARHSLVQLSGVFMPDDDPINCIIVQFFSYRSLLLYRIAQDMPLPPSLAMTMSRALVSCLTIATINHADRPHPGRWMALRERPGKRAFLEINNDPAPWAGMRRKHERMVLRKLVALKLLPLRVLRLSDGASIHYAGTLPSSADPDTPGTDGNGKVNATKNVFAVDSSSWNFLPAKGLTFTLMANARRIANRVASMYMERRA